MHSAIIHGTVSMRLLPIVFALIFSFGGNCLSIDRWMVGSVPFKMRSSNQYSMVAAQMNLRGFGASEVYAVQLRNGTPDFGIVIRSAGTIGSISYLTDVPPGQYALFAGVFQSYLYYLPGSLIGKSVVDVTPDTIVYAGNFKLGSIDYHSVSSGLPEKADSTQNDYYQGCSSKCQQKFIGIAEEIHYEKSTTDEKQMLTQALVDFSNSEWFSTIERASSALK